MTVSIAPAGTGPNDPGWEPIGTLAPTTDVTLHDLLALMEAEKQADRDGTRTSASDTSTYCRRALAYRLQATSPSDDPEPVTVATVGTLLHAGIAAEWAKEQGTMVEFRTQIGTADVIRPHRREVRDLKSVSRSKFDSWDALGGPPDGVWDQDGLYALEYLLDTFDQALAAADAQPCEGCDAPAEEPCLSHCTGRALAWDEHCQGWTLVVDAICREDGRCGTWTRPFDPDDAEESGNRLGAQAAWLLSLESPDLAPVDRSGHGDWVCDGCPWRTRCLGEDDRPAVLPDGLDPIEVMEAAEEYRHWSAIQADAKKRQEQARNRLRGAQGVFGHWSVSWSIGQPVEVPATVRKGAERITVKRVQP